MLKLLVDSYIMLHSPMILSNSFPLKISCLVNTLAFARVHQRMVKAIQGRHRLLMLHHRVEAVSHHHRHLLMQRQQGGHLRYQVLVKVKEYAHFPVWVVHWVRLAHLPTHAGVRMIVAGCAHWVCKEHQGKATPWKSHWEYGEQFCSVQRYG